MNPRPALVVALPLLLASLQGPVDAAPAEAPAERRQATQEDFQREFAAGRYSDALPLARRIVDELEAADPGSDRLPGAYNDLGAAQWRTGDVAGAEASYLRALELLEQTQGIASRRLITPLLGLAAVYAEQGDHVRAVEVLQRAVGISRRAEGLFNPEQLQLLEPLVRNFELLGLNDEVERVLVYTLRVVQKHFGVDDPRTVPATRRLAEWYEKTERLPAARMLWANLVQIGSREGGGFNATTIGGLLGISRTYRLQYVHNPESLVEAPPLDPMTGRPDPLSITAVRPRAIKLDSDGAAAAERANAILAAAADPPIELVVSAALEMGDWYTTAREPDKALPYYQRAWQALEKSADANEANPLAVPRPIAYRPPYYAYRNLNDPSIRTVQQKMEFSLSIAETGEVTGVVPVSSEAPETRVEVVQRALRKAWFSPRFENGMPVPTEGFLFVEYWHDIAPPEPAEETGSGTPTADEKKAGP